MILKAVFLGLEAGGKAVAAMNVQDAERLGVLSLARITIRFNGVEQAAIVHSSTELMQPGCIGVCRKVWTGLGLKEGLDVEVEIATFPDSHSFGLDLDEATNLSMAMFRTGSSMKLDREVVVDKHSIGGVPGDKTTLLVVPIIAACGLTIPKTSSGAITSPAGTADRAKVLMPVDLNMAEMQEVVVKTNGCIVWGGSVHLAPADDIFVKVEYPLSIDPLLLPSIMSKKKAVGANLLVVDIPCGRGAKVKTIGEADLLAKDFLEIGSRLGIKVRCAVTYGEQPIGYAVGPALEAKEALQALMGRGSPLDLIEKATDIAGMILELAGKSDGKRIAAEALRSGKAEQKMREIIAAQGGDPKITPEEIAIADHQFTFQSDNPFLPHR